MSAHKVCLAGSGQKVSLWLSIYRGEPTECTIEEPSRQEHVKVDDWFADHVLLLPINPKHGPKTTNVCPYLTLHAGKRAATAMRDYSVTGLAMALIAHYGWQVANGAKVLPEKGEIAKVYAGEFAVYLFETRRARATACQQTKHAVTG